MTLRSIQMILGTLGLLLALGYPIVQIFTRFFGVSRLVLLFSVMLTITVYASLHVIALKLRKTESLLFTLEIAGWITTIFIPIGIGIAVYIKYNH
jgi:hypothetical protein